MYELIGRDRERDAAATFVAAAASGPAMLSIDGEPGVGKSTLFRHTLELARSSGSTVLECSPTAAESALSYTGLTDMLRHIGPNSKRSAPGSRRVRDWTAPGSIERWTSSGPVGRGAAAIKWPAFDRSC
ncbi:MAG: transcriptional regulator, luxR family [Ilumatobacteraceae bacterium]|nr:transcriptional regulator, luxR family [Ilumatobacteraceae bacterium]